jgi:hypothetical protein
MAQTIIAGNPGFDYIADIRRLQVPAGTYAVSVYTRWSGAKDPAQQRCVLQLTTDADGLKALRALIDAGVAP